MSQILQYSAPYGIVISGGTEGIQQCFERYVKNNRIKTLQLVLNYTSTLKVRWFILEIHNSNHSLAVLGSLAAGHNTSSN